MVLCLRRFCRQSQEASSVRLPWVCTSPHPTEGIGTILHCIVHYAQRGSLTAFALIWLYSPQVDVCENREQEQEKDKEQERDKEYVGNKDVGQDAKEQGKYDA